MHWLRISTILVLAGQAALSDGPSDRAKAAHHSNLAELAPISAAGRDVPPVMRRSEPADNTVVVLPGPTPVRASVPVETRSGPPPKPFRMRALPAFESHSFTASLPAPPVVAAAPLPPLPLALKPLMGVWAAPKPPEAGVVEPSKPAYPIDFTADSAIFLQKKIGQWTLADARLLLGDPQGERAAVDDDQTENGRIYALPDPSNRYQQLELDFDKDNGVLRTVFAYPRTLTWQDCRRQWGANVTATDANQGRIFYSYINRKLDVLVAPGGRVISLGLY